MGKIMSLVASDELNEFAVVREMWSPFCRKLVGDNDNVKDIAAPGNEIVQGLPLNNSSLEMTKFSKLSKPVLP